MPITVRLPGATWVRPLVSKYSRILYRPGRYTKISCLFFDLEHAFLIGDLHCNFGLAKELPCTHILWGLTLSSLIRSKGRVSVSSYAPALRSDFPFVHFEVHAHSNNHLAFFWRWAIILILLVIAYVELDLTLIKPASPSDIIAAQKT